ncbi:UDP-N-acetylmuramoyl-tripeptide--D-alanyl-D-alanine ligase [Rheinheimera sp. MMS21-TC3]|uniref:UDP-N-acetylmuramoyl-tripeptide--D-alanyl-D- alanine ligase n=1 Tax=Rheinheimera sp. MMS21-TC3 TaxID=3072790 RepID=UPI0028C477B2|nr:UDP-N-acetylmuramoyl-tripeptide--D-alanyl-D-alanine ligase [Rheinheimera sp. MMS21-TC3]WNO60320.1 UDP-N-acetylmuramoyl-tripeptide--D-alanyl-D-alanine ligase [Rheinheimera sp. MMS21-TC3]
MISLSCQDITQIVQGRLVGADAIITSVSTDSRNISPGQLFIALKGPNFDAANFVADVKAQGAAAVIVERPVAVEISQIIVADSRVALGQLAAAVKAKLGLASVAVTGSAGKTTVKEMIAAILSRSGSVLATKGNFNNDIGLPLTLLELTQQHKYAVLELGANHQGEIAYTTALAKPDVAIITNVAASHLEGFGSIAGVATAKAEIFTGLTTNGVAIIPADSEFTEFWLQRLNGVKVLQFSSSQHSNQQADYYASQITLALDGCAQFILHSPQGQIAVKLALPGKHNINNALAAAAASICLGASLADVQLGLANMKAVKGRTNILQLSPKLRIIDDSYNANVESVKAAIDLLASYSGTQILVLGDMGELGPDARLYHQEVGLYAKKAGINLLFTLGVLSNSASDLLQQQGAHFSSRQALVSRLLATINEQQKVTLLVKGSRSAKMELVVQDLLESCQQEINPC